MKREGGFTLLSRMSDLRRGHSPSARRKASSAGFIQTSEFLGGGERPNESELLAPSLVVDMDAIFPPDYWIPTGAGATVPAGFTMPQPEDTAAQDTWIEFTTATAEDTPPQ